MPLSAGTIVAGYRIERVLGSGGMGTVYLARHRTLPRSDALKILSAELSVDTEFRARFIREADLAATLNHPNIVTIFDRGETDDGQLWIAMEFVDGTAADSKKVLAQMTSARAVYIVKEIAKALDYAHSRKLLHRDIKPGNFLLSGPVGDQERVLLADFGIARALDDATSLTATGALLFTAAYAAPEAVQGGPVDHRADIYALGCSLFRLVTGRTPYAEFSGLSAMLMAHVMQPIPRATAVAPNLPPAIDDVIAHALAKNPAERFQSAGALAAAAAAALGAHPAIRPTGAETRDWSTPAPAYPHPSLHLPSHTRPTVPAPARSGSSAPPQQYLDAQRRGPAPPQPPPPTGPGRGRRRRRGLILGALALAGIVAAAAVVGVSLLAHQGGGLPPYQAQSLDGKYGTVQLNHRPLSIAALGPGDPDAVLSLGVQPAAISGPPGTLPSWLQDMVHSSPQRLAITDAAAVAATKPDLIVDTGDIAKATYDKLAAVAPTLTRSNDMTQPWTWQTQLSWIAKALGRDNTAKTLLDEASAQQNKIRSEHPAFAGKTITVVNYTDSATTVAARESPATSYLEGIGFTYNTKFTRDVNDPLDTAVNLTSDSNYQVTSTDVVIVARTDKGAGSGGYAGLPAIFRIYSGVLVIVDDGATITALQTGGPAATKFLNGTLVNTLADQIH